MRRPTEDAPALYAVIAAFVIYDTTHTTALARLGLVKSSQPIRARRSAVIPRSAD